MARRGRVPRHKSHTRNRNVNPKLSPFQREQKREKLANQVPTAATMGSLDSIPHSQRKVFEYLQAKKVRQEQRRAALLQEREEQRQEGEAEEEQQQQQQSVAPQSTSASGEALAAETPAEGIQRKKWRVTETENAEAEPEEDGNSAEEMPTTKKKQKKKAKALEYASLNDELSSSVGAALEPLARRYAAALSAMTSTTATESSEQPRTVEEIIAKKKERKHRKKQEARRVRVSERLQKMETELQRYSASPGGKASKRSKSGGTEEGGATHLAFERKLREMQKEAEKEKALVTTAASLSTSSRRRRRETSGDDGGDEGSSEHRRRSGNTESRNGENTGNEDDSPKRKRISFDASVPDANGAEGNAKSRTSRGGKKPQDFYELVDVVRYGERVEAPPVFDAVPSSKVAISRLASRLETEETASRGRRNGSSEERHRLLAGGGSLGTQKRLARLGLAPAITGTIRMSDQQVARSSKEEEMKALRERVMATYQRNRSQAVALKKGVNMHHEFPKFS